MSGAILVTMVTLALFTASASHAHPLQFGVIEVTDPHADAVDVLLRFSPGEARDRAVHIEFGPGCTLRNSPRLEEFAYARVTRSSYDCASDSTQRTLRVEGLSGRPEQLLVRYPDPIHGTRHALLSGGHPELTFGGAPTEGMSFLQMGIEHIWTGWDHLLFVFALFLLISGPKRLFWTVTAFTVGHSLTLGWTTLGGPSPPSEATEAIIAMSILLVALELARNAPENESWAARAPWAIAGICGLVHGFGFANALLELGLHRDAVVPALFGFNLGVEIGQLGFIALLGIAIHLFRRYTGVGSDRQFSLVVYGLGSTASFLLIARLVDCFA